MAAEPQVAWSNSGNITAGWVLGIIATCVIGLFVMVVLLGALTG
jgi:hypothetical protein